MLLGVYTIKDIVAQQTSDLKLFKNEELAKRWFNDILSESKISQDLQLYKVCDYDIDKGCIVIDEKEYFFNFVMGGKV